MNQNPNNLLAVPIVSRSLVKMFDGCISELSNYRPISMLSAVARVFERLIYEQLPEYFQEYNFLIKYQSGFRTFHSTVTSMLKTTNDWLLNMNERLYTGVVYFDLKKTFDTADHSILLSKLSRYGVNDIEL